MNKLLLAQALSSANIKTPVFYQNSNQNELFEMLDEWEGEILMKPVRSSFGRGIVRFVNKKHLKEFLIANKIELSNFFFQPYIDGSDLTVNVIASKGIHILNWNGIACFDLRRDKLSGEIFILEINGRFWASLLAALKRGGINFPLLMAKYAMGEQIETTEKKYDYQISLKRLFREIMKGKLANWIKTKYNLYLADPLARFYQIFCK